MCCALLVMVVALAQFGPESASATAHKRPDFGSAEGFRLECELLGGTYSEDGIGTLTATIPTALGPNATPTATTAGLPHRERYRPPKRWTWMTSRLVRRH